MNIINRNQTRIILLILLCALACLSIDPALANKFQTIGGGVSGSNQIKTEFIKWVAYVVAGIFFLSSVLTVITRNNNAQTANYSVWKTSASILLVLAVGATALGVYL